MNISKDSENVSVKNLHYIVEDEDSICEINCNNAKLSSCLIDGILIERKSAKHYVGSDFSAYKTNWQTGKINLQTRVSNIFYQSKVTEDILFEKGFQKTDLSSKVVI